MIIISKKFKFRPYRGKDKYHFRFAKKARHPIIVTNVDYDKEKLYGHLMTDSESKSKNSNFHALTVNPNFNSKKTSYVDKHRSGNNWNLYSDPYNNWHLSLEDEKYIDSLELRAFKRKKKHKKKKS